jgi:hypothetical protein
VFHGKLSNFAIYPVNVNRSFHSSERKNHHQASEREFLFYSEIFFEIQIQRHSPLLNLEIPVEML